MDLHAELVRLKAAPELPEWIVGTVQSLIDQAQDPSLTLPGHIFASGLRNFLISLSGSARTPLNP
jgi:hypothetical protein